MLEVMEESSEYKKILEIIYILLQSQEINFTVEKQMIKIEGIKYKILLIEFKNIVLKLHRNFNTAHSSSATRVNFFIRVSSQKPETNIKHYGYGQCGLPPKKPGCYMSDINDCYEFINRLRQRLDKENKKNQNSEQILKIPQYIQNKLHQIKTQLKQQVIKVMKVLQQFSQIQNFRAPKCALQFALIDLLTKYHQMTVTQFLFDSVPLQHKSYSFYTASLQQNKQMIQNARQHLKITQYIKFKYNNDIARLIELLKVVNKQKIGGKLIIDANCSWKPTDFLVFLQHLKNEQFQQSNFAKKILYIQQPFDLDITNYQEWKQIKNKSPIKILADQSFRNQKDIQKIKLIAHAVNIKTQKTGGVFSTLRAALKAKEQGLQVMFGSMCSTQLGCSQTFQFFPLAKYMDIDGALLVKQPQLEGGFYWSQNGEVKPYDNKKGLRINAEDFFKEQKQ